MNIEYIRYLKTAKRGNSPSFIVYLHLSNFVISSHTYGASPYRLQYFDNASPKTRRGHVVAFFLFVLASWPLIFLPLGITGISIITFFLWAMFSTYADATMQVKAQCEAFSKFMKMLTGMNQPSIGPALFAQYLPYSASFGLLIPWAKTLQRQGMLALPNWFRRLVTAGHPDHSGDPMRSFVAMVEITHELTHKDDSSSGSDGSNVSGSSGAAGGGSMGAG